jgi:hypothetical protein
MALRPVSKKKEYVITKIYQSIQQGKVDGVSQKDVIIVTDPELVSLYDFVDTFYHIGKAIETIFKYFRSKESD